jgi:hypothetical protein
MIKNHGEVRGTGTITVSEDGKTRTVKTSVRNAKGDLVENEGVYIFNATHSLGPLANVKSVDEEIPTAAPQLTYS